MMAENTVSLFIIKAQSRSVQFKSLLSVSKKREILRVHPWRVFPLRRQKPVQRFPCAWHGVLCILGCTWYRRPALHSPSRCAAGWSLHSFWIWYINRRPGNGRYRFWARGTAGKPASIWRRESDKLYKRAYKKYCARYMKQHERGRVQGLGRASRGGSWLRH